MTIYADILFLTEFFADSFIIVLSAIFLRRTPPVLRIMLGAFLSAFLSVIFFISDIHIFSGLLLKMALCGLIPVTVFGKNRAIKSIMVFAMITLLAGGVVFFISILTDFGYVMKTVISNGVVYLNINPVILVISSILLYVFCEIFRRLCIKSFSKNNLYMDLTAIWGSRKINFTGLIDTGCELCDTISGAPVILAEKRLFSKMPKTDLLIPIRTASGTAELELLIPDKIFGQNKKYFISEKYMIALTNERLNADGIYSALINPSGIEEIYAQQNKEGIVIFR